MCKPPPLFVFTGTVAYDLSTAVLLYPAPVLHLAIMVFQWQGFHTLEPTAGPVSRTLFYGP
jgi:hypothetical protein